MIDDIRKRKNDYKEEAKVLLPPVVERVGLNPFQNKPKVNNVPVDSQRYNMPLQKKDPGPGAL